MSEINADDNDRSFIPFDGLIVRQSSKAVQFAGGAGGMKPFWIAKSQLGRIWYADDTGSREIRVGRMVREIEIPWWLAKEVGLR